jgi:hypothetical protein
LTASNVTRSPDISAARWTAARTNDAGNAVPTVSLTGCEWRIADCDS